MRGFAPNLLISQPERLPRCDFRDCSCSCSDGHVDIFSSVSLSENRQGGIIRPWRVKGVLPDSVGKIYIFQNALECPETCPTCLVTSVSITGTIISILDFLRISFKSWKKNSNYFSDPSTIWQQSFNHTEQVPSNHIPEESVHVANRASTNFLKTNQT